MPPTAPTLQLLGWVAERARSYAETIEAWKTSCPRLSVWEDALADRLVRVERGSVVLTAAGDELLAAPPPAPRRPGESDAALSPGPPPPNHVLEGGAKRRKLARPLEQLGRRDATRRDLSRPSMLHGPTDPAKPR